MDKIQQILNGPMLCESGARSSLLIAIVSAIKNGSINAMEEKLTNDDIVSKAYAMNPISGKVQTADEYELNENDLPDNSVAVLWLEGMIYPWKSYRLEQQIIAIKRKSAHRGHFSCHKLTWWHGSPRRYYDQCH